MSTPSIGKQRLGPNKFNARRRMLAEAALTTIAEQGYAQTGLRDIAQHSQLSHGSLHYYFDSKDDLVSLAVWNYKSECAKRYDGIVENAQTPQDLAQQVSTAMAATLQEDGNFHRLWYDLRNQAQFSEGFRDTIVAIDGLLEDMVWRILVRYAELSGGHVQIDKQLAYALFDGMFSHALLRVGRGDTAAIEHMRTVAPTVLLQAAVSAPAA